MRYKWSKAILLIISVFIALTGCGSSVEEFLPDSYQKKPVDNQDYIFFGERSFVMAFDAEDDPLEVNFYRGFDMKDLNFYKVNVDGAIVSGGPDNKTFLQVDYINGYKQMSLEDAMEEFGFSEQSLDSSPEQDFIPVFYRDDEGILYMAARDFDHYDVMSEEGRVGAFETWEDVKKVIKG